MLVLSRKLNETILIGENIRVTLLGIDGDKIKIGIDAPKDVKVFREELLEATRSTNKQALDAPIVSFDLSKLKRPPSATGKPDKDNSAAGETRADSDKQTGA